MPILLIGLSAWAWTGIVTATGLAGLVAASRFWTRRQGVRLAEAYIKDGSAGLRAAIQEMKLAKSPSEEDEIVKRFEEEYLAAATRAEQREEKGFARRAAHAAVS